MSEKKFKSRDYYEASIERYKDALILKKHKNSIIFAIYTAGVSIESILRANIVYHTPEFDSKHDLIKLYYKSGIANNLKANEKAKITSKIKTANDIWSNNLRYFQQIDITEY